MPEGAPEGTMSSAASDDETTTGTVVVTEADDVTLQAVSEHDEPEPRARCASRAARERGSLRARPRVGARQLALCSQHDRPVELLERAPALGRVVGSATQRSCRPTPSTSCTGAERDPSPTRAAAAAAKRDSARS